MWFILVSSLQVLLKLKFFTPLFAVFEEHYCFFFKYEINKFDTMTMFQEENSLRIWNSLILNHKHYSTCHFIHFCNFILGIYLSNGCCVAGWIQFLTKAVVYFIKMNIFYGRQWRMFHKNWQTRLVFNLNLFTNKGLDIVH